MEFHAEAHVGLVAAVFADGVFVEHVRERCDGFYTGDRAGTDHHLFQHVENVFLAGEGHFDVELREFQLAVGALVFVAETFHDLEIAIEAADHQDLFENLGRLRERVKLAVMDAAGNEKVARAFRSGAGQHGSFDFEEAQLVHGLANLEQDLVAQR